MSRTLRSHMSRAKPVPKQWDGFMESVRKASARDSTDLVRKDAYKWLMDAGSTHVSKANNQIESAGIYGGFTVPPDFNMSIATSYEEECFLYPRATVVPMLSKTTQLPRVNAETAQSAGVPPWWGGMAFAWGTGGTGTITATNPTLAQNELTAHSLIGTVTASMNMAEDYGVAGNDFLFNMFARGAAYNEEYAFLNGLGGSQDQPMGIIKSPSFIKVTRAGAGHIAQADVALMTAAMTPRGWMHGIWACSPSAIGDLVKITGYIPNQSGFETLGISAIGSLFGRPVFVTDKLPILGTSGDLIFIDPTQYIIGDRAELVVQISDEKLFTTYQRVYRIWRRVDGQPLFSTFITGTDGSSKISPFVGIA